MGDKICAACCAKSSIKELRDTNPIFNFEEVFDQPHHKELGLRIKVKETGSLLLDPDMKHPFVRMHIIDYDTGMYLKK